MFCKYILLLTLAVASSGMLNTSLWSDLQKGCTEEQFKCSNGDCIHNRNRCDGSRDCRDRSDELNCTSCKENGFRCGDGECVDNKFICDLYDDCEDGSDENNCTNHVCGMYEFQCQNGQCISSGSRCDGFNHCSDGSDEENCLECYEFGGSITRNSFKCVSSDKCILQIKVCDSIKDCPDGSDEDPATCQNYQCPEDIEVQCKAGNCIPFFAKCIEADICSDSHKIEKPYLNCTLECHPEMFKCDEGTKCEDKQSLCDGVPDCEDGSDESDLLCSERECEWNRFKCQSGQCLGIRKDNSVICNGHYDCGDESDEANCTTCSTEAFKCGIGECVHKSQLCNLKADCSDGSDENEINCPHGSTPPVLTTIWRASWLSYTPNVTLQYLTEDLAVYFDSSVSPNVTWPFMPLSQAWKYAKKTFELETLSEPGSQFLYVVLGKLKQDQRNKHDTETLENPEKNFSFRSRKSGYRNVVDPGMRERNGWVTQNTANFEKLISSLAYIVESAMEGVENNADKKLCDSTLRNIVFYDIYIHLKGRESADVVQYKANQFNRTFGVGQYNCFRDWYLPVYEKYGGATVLNNYFHIFKTNWPRNRGGVSVFYSYKYKGLNVGEFIHFWSGAAGEDLRYLAKSAFYDWNDVFMRLFVKAQTDFPNITYPLTIMSGNHCHNGHLNYMEKSSSHHLRS